mmetsp:Transcript_30745/g.42838  ORF Transcript_30745/g.42838 Transcript_30745/m.42838 type:complete len:95 (+) Transcript_30745:134-418(+)
MEILQLLKSAPQRTSACTISEIILEQGRSAKSWVEAQGLDWAKLVAGDTKDRNREVQWGNHSLKEVRRLYTGSFQNEASKTSTKFAMNLSIVPL